MDFYKIGFKTVLEKTEDMFTKIQMYINDEEGLVKYDEAMDMLRAIIQEVNKNDR